MAALTLRLPDDKHQRLRALAQSRRTTINRLMNEMTTLMLAEYDAETRFKLRAARAARGAGQAANGLALLDRVAQARPASAD
jgi:predicted transcriptional regulator